MGRDLESLFDRYRRKGDLRALEKVFDRTARDLLALAQHLVRDVDDAEDLVQATFVTAIDRAHSFDRSRALRPWLSPKAQRGGEIVCACFGLSRGEIVETIRKHRATTIDALREHLPATRGCGKSDAMAVPRLRPPLGGPSRQPGT